MQSKSFDIEKMKLIRSVSARLADLDVDDVNLLMYEAGLREFGRELWLGDDQGWEPTESDRRREAGVALRDLDTSDLIGFDTAISQVFDSTASTTPQSVLAEPEPLRLFASHLTTQKVFLHQVADNLRLWKISLFVAHDDIEPDAHWHASIEANLQAVDGGVVFLYPGIDSSKWCDQEIGWLLGRGVPVRALKFAGQDPYGPLGKQQALTVQDNASGWDVAALIVDWAAKRPGLAPQFNASMVTSLATSISSIQSNALWDRLRGSRALTTAQVATVATAVRDNPNVYAGAYAGPVVEEVGQVLSALMLPWLVLQRGYPANAEMIRTTAVARGLGSLVPSPAGGENRDVWSGAAVDSPF
ncbi:hypothetical protein [Cryobacterium sp. TMT3-29-2]|uniref:hypothetical protein n=1 Tax=Cryobacterium sp. TMT3-29-2 TaxID=2555867 RepID=UPI00142FF094|nr:hypothetical protein [Cryobacterium sp. TMT3-29-2]